MTTPTSTDQPVPFTFRTKTGVCTVTPDQIILTRSGVRGAAAEQVVGNSILRPLVLYSVLGGAALIGGLWSLARGPSFFGIFLLLVGILLLWNVVASRGNSASSVIPRAAIRAIEAHPPHPPMTRGYFNVFFTEDGQERTRIIMLPGSLADGQAEYERAESILRTSGLLPTP